MRATAMARESTKKLPRYMCTQTIDRRQFEDTTRRNSQCEEDPRSRRAELRTSDRLRLDVAMAVGREMYTWVGEEKFGDTELLDMIQEGAISTGAYSDFLAGIFGNNDTLFTYNGDTTVDGRDLSEFGYRIPANRSGYRWGRPGSQVTIGHDGDFLVDRKSGEMVRLVVRTERLPADTGACYATTTLDYQRVLIRGEYFLLPKQTNLHIVTPQGADENRTVFSACHEFQGKSTLSFGDPEETDARAPVTLHERTTIPPGLNFRVSLTQGFDTAISAGGDAVKAKLLSPIKDHDKVIAPAGAIVNARISRIRLYYGKAPKVTLEIKLESVEVAGGAIPLVATPFKGRNFQDKSQQTVLKNRVELGTLRNLEEHSLTYEFDLNHIPFVIKSGLESVWVTVAPN